MVGEQFSLSCQSHGIDAVWLKDADGKGGSYTHNDKWHEELVATGKFGDKEYSRKRGVHDPCHHSCHT